MLTTTSVPPRPRAASHPRTRSVARRADVAVARVAQLLTRWSVPVLRVALGLVFLGFGVLKFFPGASPAETIASRTVETLTLGVVDGATAVVLTATLETFIGLTLITGRLLRVGLLALAVAMAGILSPLVLFAGELFGHGVTLLGQYVLKDIVLVAGAAVVAAVALGARLRRET
ncbi:DoxX family membrane protein [Isoptericola sp. NEAU-Y5]|uniref:DoxX family membrane protein n=1 Tax=Isoptericola luteus TaxID=2879484 RepID=A0ABS7ZG50_9MICO|nr:DoxX family membrane protein [Isoptericola sp. NEAU-Y5]MCA5894000.1 DoxX family membrane protein [Isoptericola sp. NEAU-Y5]